jgi:hypothetical protein
MRMLRVFYHIAFVSTSLVAGIAAALLLMRLKLGSAAAHHSAIASIDTALPDQPQHTRGSISEFSTNGSQADILQLPKANMDFVGYWGGYIHSSIRRLNPDLIGASPDRISVVFGRRGDTVFMASELYSLPKQKIVHRPKARVVGARRAIVEYESADNDLYYVCSDRFWLNDASRISYQSTVDVYSRNRRRLMGVVTERATLKRLRTPREQLEFARPGRNQIPRAEISASASVAPR